MNQKNKTYNAENELPEIILVGLNHKTAPVAIREKFSFSGDALTDFIEKACDRFAHEIVYISTCNRVSIYFTAHSYHASIQQLETLLEEYTGLSKEDFSKLLYKKYAKEAVSHLFSVISSLDSMVLGENEIFGQVKEAYRACVQLNSTGLLLNRLFHQAFTTGKRVRTETEIAKNPVSIAYIATEKAKQVLADITNKKALLIGAGEMGERILKYFSKTGIPDIYLANRSIEKAEQLACGICQTASIYPLESISQLLREVDIVISSVTVDNYLINKDAVEQLMPERNEKPLVFIDIAVPRNIDPACSEIDTVYVYNIDTLKQVSEENIQNRQNETKNATRIIEEECMDYLSWMTTLEMAPIINKLHNKFDEVRNQELEKYRRRKLKHLSHEDFAIIEELTRQIMSKTLHNPIMAIKKYQQVKSKRHIDLESIIEELFHK